MNSEGVFCSHMLVVMRCISGWFLMLEGFCHAGKFQSFSSSWLKLQDLNLASLASFLFPQKRAIGNICQRVWFRSGTKHTIKTVSQTRNVCFVYPTLAIKIDQILRKYTNILSVWVFIFSIFLHHFFLRCWICQRSKANYKLWNDTETWPFSVGEGWHVFKP